MKLKNLSTGIGQSLIISCLLLLMSSGAFAQGSLSINGSVLDASTREPLIGVSVTEKGTSNGTVTNMDGIFTLQVKRGATIAFSYVGYRDLEVSAARASGEILLQEDDQTLSEVVVVGYGTQKKVNLSGAVSAVEGDKLAAKPTSDVLSAMQGELPGVAVLRSSGEPGSEPQAHWYSSTA